MAGQWKLSFQLPLTFQEGNTCNKTTGWKPSLAKPPVSFCPSNLLPWEGRAFGVFGMLTSLAIGLVSFGQHWVLAECIRWPWPRKSLFPFATLLKDICLSLEALNQTKAESVGASSFHHSARGRGWGRFRKACAVACPGNSEIAWQMFLDSLTFCSSACPYLHRNGSWDRPTKRG